MHLFHKWGPWEQYTLTFEILPRTLEGQWLEIRGKLPEVNERWQKRVCLKCNFMQEKKVSDYRG